MQQIIYTVFTIYYIIYMIFNDYMTFIDKNQTQNCGILLLKLLDILRIILSKYTVMRYSI